MLNVIFVNPDTKAALERADIVTEEAILRWDRGERIVQKNWADAYRWTLKGVGTVYVKRYFPQRNRLLGLFRQNLAVREFECSRVLSRLGIPQAEPVLAALAVNRLGLTVCGVYMMREVENAESLDVILERMRERPNDAELEAIADELIRLLEAMHGGGFCHWDFKPRNLLVARRDGRVVITPIDARSGKKIRFYRRGACIERDRRFLLREPLLGPLLEERLNIRPSPVKPFELTLTARDKSTTTLYCGRILRRIEGRRTVFDGTYDGVSIIIKRFEDRFGWYRCRREKRGLERLRERGLPAPKALLDGKDGQGHHVLVIEKIEGAVDGDGAVKRADSDETVKTILLEVFRYAARLHQAGVVQHDLHLGNFLIAGSAVWAIDPAWMRFRKQPVGEAASCRQLAILLATFPKEYLTWQADLLQAYCQVRGLNYTAEMLDTVRRLARRRRKKRLPHILRKTLRNSRHFFVLKAGSYRGVFSKASFTIEGARMVLDKLASAVCENNQEVIGDYNERQFRFVCYGPKTSTGLFLSAFVKSEARRDWLAAWKARFSGQISPAPAALIERFFGPMVTQSWLVSEREPIKCADG